MCLQNVLFVEHSTVYVVCGFDFSDLLAQCFK